MAEEVDFIGIFDNYFNIEITKEDYDKDLRVELGLDSIDAIELAMELEAVLKIDIPDSVVDEANTINDIIRNIKEL